MKTAKLFAGLIAAFTISVLSCPQELPIYQYPFSFTPLPVVIVNETFTGYQTGTLNISSTGSSLNCPYGVFRKTPDTPSDAVFSIVDDCERRALKIQNQGGAGGGLVTEFLFVPSMAAYNSMRGQKVLLQFRVRLENTNAVTLSGPTVYSNCHEAGSPGGGKLVESLISGSGNIQFTGSDKVTTMAQNRWHNIEMLCDFGSEGIRETSQKCMVYFNGNLINNDYFFTRPALSAGTVQFSMSTYGTTVYISGITISTE